MVRPESKVEPFAEEPRSGTTSGPTSVLPSLSALRGSCHLPSGDARGKRWPRVEDFAVLFVLPAAVAVTGVAGRSHLNLHLSIAAGIRAGTR